jgi:mono/diheme cytochrome c family protein
MRLRVRLSSAALLMLAGVSVAQAAPQGKSATVARGKYIVNSTSMCNDCHTPHDARGMAIKEKMLQGTKLDFKPNEPLPPAVWSDTAPKIAGLPMLSDNEAVVLFTTGKMPDGKTARAPMPQFRFSQRDAEAVTAYLKSLK